MFNVLSSVFPGSRTQGRPRPARKPRSSATIPLPARDGDDVLVTSLSDPLVCERVRVVVCERVRLVRERVLMRERVLLRERVPLPHLCTQGWGPSEDTRA